MSETTLRNTERIPVVDKTGAAWDAFVDEMRDRQYGPEETADAWLWFKTGWDRRQILLTSKLGERDLAFFQETIETYQRHGCGAAVIVGKIAPELLHELRRLRKL